MKSMRNGENQLRNGSFTSALYGKDQEEADLIDFTWSLRVAAGGWRLWDCERRGNCEVSFEVNHRRLGGVAARRR